MTIRILRVLTLVVAGVAGLLSMRPASAVPITYTFSGTGAGLVNQTGFDGAFTFVFTADTADIDSSGAPFYRLNNVGGTFSQGAYSATLTATVTIIGTADASFPRINFFNAAINNGLGMNDPALATYDLSTAFGPLTVSDPGSPDSFLTPTFGGGGFATEGGDTVSITANSSLTFTAVTAAVGVPEPASLALLGVGLAGIGLARRRRG